MNRENSFSKRKKPTFRQKRRQFFEKQALFFKKRRHVFKKLRHVFKKRSHIFKKRSPLFHPSTQPCGASIALLFQGETPFFTLTKGRKRLMACHLPTSCVTIHADAPAMKPCGRIFSHHEHLILYVILSRLPFHADFRRHLLHTRHGPHAFLHALRRSHAPSPPPTNEAERPATATNLPPSLIGRQRTPRKQPRQFTPTSQQQNL